MPAPPAKNSPSIVTIRFRVPFTRAAEIEEAFAADAPSIAALPALRWKMWTFDETRREFQSVYLFESRGDAERFTKGPVVESLHEDPNLSEIEVRVHDVLSSLSRATRAPIG